MVASGIQDNPSCQHFRLQLLGFRVIVFLMWFGSLFGLFSRKKVQELRTQMKEMQNSFDSLVRIPDEFNAAFSQRGWIAYEKMNHEVMEQCVSLAKEGRCDEAEGLLQEYYTEKCLELHIVWAKASHDALMDRWHQMRQALQEYQHKRYYSCIPLLLMIIDGAVNDIDKSQGFSGLGSDVEAWDSIAGHSSGLAEIKKIYTKTRNKTNDEEITLPYRNGILHGRDLNYGNKRLAAKCWGILFAVADWASAKRTEQRRKEELAEEQKPASIADIVDSVKQHKQWKDEFDKYQDEWESRSTSIGENIPVSGKSEEYGKRTPERTLVEFFELWRQGNYGRMAQMTTQVSEPNDGKRAGQYRSIFSDKELVSFGLTKIEDCGSAFTLISVQMEVNAGKDTERLDQTFRLLHEEESGSPLPRGIDRGTWKVAEDFWPIEYIGSEK